MSLPKKIKMAWEWNWPTFVIYNSIRLIDFSIRFDFSGNHSPGFHVDFLLFNCRLLDFGYYNIHHEDCDRIPVQVDGFYCTYLNELDSMSLDDLKAIITKDLDVIDMVGNKTIKEITFLNGGAQVITE